MGVDVHKLSGRIEKQLGTMTGDYSGKLEPPMSRIEALIYELMGKLKKQFEEVSGNIEELQTLLEKYKLKIIIVDALPEKGDTWTFYLVYHEHDLNDKSKKDYYDEYIWNEDKNAFELLGNTDIDLSGYPKYTDIIVATQDEVKKILGGGSGDGADFDIISFATGSEIRAVLDKEG